VAVLLLAGYVGAYYLTVSREIRIGSESSGGSREVLTVTLVPKDRLLLGCGPLFTPIHWLDRRIRPHVWEPMQ
jgi:hypothetical protein